MKSSASEPGLSETHRLITKQTQESFCCRYFSSSNINLNFKFKFLKKAKINFFFVWDNLAFLQRCNGKLKIKAIKSLCIDCFGDETFFLFFSSSFFFFFFFELFRKFRNDWSLPTFSYLIFDTSPFGRQLVTALYERLVVVPAADVWVRHHCVRAWTTRRTRSWSTAPTEPQWIKISMHAMSYQ